MSRDKQKEDYLRKIRLGSRGMLAAVLSITALKGFFSYKLILRSQVFCVIAPCGLVISFSLVILKNSNTFIHGLLTHELTHNPKMKAVRFFETSENNYPIIRSTNTEVLVPQLSAGGHQSHCFRIKMYLFPVTVCYSSVMCCRYVVRIL